MTEFEPLPDFLNLKRPDTRARWEQGRKMSIKLSRISHTRKVDFHLPKTLSIEAKAMIKSQRREKAQKLRNLRKKRQRGS